MDIDLPGIYIDRVVSANVEKKIELLTLTKDEGSRSSDSSTETAASVRRVKIAKRAAKEVGLL